MSKVQSTLKGAGFPKSVVSLQLLEASPFDKMVSLMIFLSLMNSVKVIFPFIYLFILIASYY